MIPFLYYGTEKDFEHNGIGRLSDCIQATVTEERNGSYELEFDYPVTGEYFDQILIGRIVAVTHDDKGDLQPFVIYRRSAAINGIATFNAFHISYNLTYTSIDLAGAPHTLTDLFDAFSGRSTQEHYIYGEIFDFSTDIVSTATWTWPVPAGIKSLLFGQDGSILDTYGGEFEFDKYSVILHKSRGEDNGVTIRYGKNLSDLTDVQEGMNLYSYIIPYWYDGTERVTTGPTKYYFPEIYWWTTHDAKEGYITDENDVEIEFLKTQINRGIPVDFTNKFQTKPTYDELNAAAREYLAANRPWEPKRDITVSYIPLWQTLNAGTNPDLDRVHLCDTVRVIYERLGVVATAKVIKVKWNALLDRYDEITIGQIIDRTEGYTGRLKIDGKIYMINAGLITAVQ